MRLATARRALLVALVTTCSAVQPQGDRGEQVAAIHRLEAQTGILAPAAAKELTAGSAAPGNGLTARQPPVDRNEQVAAIRRLEIQTGVEAPAAAKEITAGARATWGSALSRGEGWNREAFEDVVVPEGHSGAEIYSTKEVPSIRDLRRTLSKSPGQSNKTRINNRLALKTVWIFWAQGEAHLAAQKQGKYANCLVTCVQRWRDLNPDWTVEMVDDARAKELAPSYARFAKKGSIGQALLSDVLRLDLLTKYGGVWADVSVCPVSPLDDYIEDKLAPAGFFTLWLNHWPTADDALSCETKCYDEDSAHCTSRTTVTWFMATSSPKNFVVHAWHQALIERMSKIEKGSNDYPYFLVHCVFTDMIVNGEDHLSAKLALMPKDLPAGDAGWASALNLDPFNPNRMVDKFHKGCPRPSTKKRDESREQHEADRKARDEAAAAADEAASPADEAAPPADEAASPADEAAAEPKHIPPEPDACPKCGQGENCCGKGGAWAGMCPKERSWEDGHIACNADMVKNGIPLPVKKTSSSSTNTSSSSTSSSSSWTARQEDALFDDVLPKQKTKATPS